MAKREQNLLVSLADEALDALAKAPIADVLNAAKGVVVGSNQTMDASLLGVFPTPTALRKAIREKTNWARSAALPLLAAIDRDTAKALFAKMAPLLANHPKGSPAAAAAFGLWQSSRALSGGAPAQPTREEPRALDEDDLVTAYREAMRTHANFAEAAKRYVKGRGPEVATRLLGRLLAEPRKKSLAPWQRETFLVLSRIELAAARASAPSLDAVLAIGDPSLTLSIVDALAKVDPSSARDAALAQLEAVRRGHVRFADAWIAALAKHVSDFDALEPLLADGRVAGAIFGSCERWIVSDARFLERAAKAVVSRGPGHRMAKGLLSRADPRKAAAALERAGFEAPRAKAPSAPTRPPKTPRWLARYRRGEHDEVWAELRALGTDIPEVLREEARDVAIETMTRARENLERIAEAIAGVGYPFRARKPIGRPTPLARKKSAVVDSLPLALVAFYEIVGSVDFSERPNAVYVDDAAAELGLGACDPLLVVPFAAALAEQEEREKENAHVVAALRPRPLWFLGPSPEVKRAFDVTEDAPYVLSPEGGAEGTVMRAGRRERVPFVDWLRRAIVGGGFLRADRRAARFAKGTKPF